VEEEGGEYGPQKDRGLVAPYWLSSFLLGTSPRPHLANLLFSLDCLILEDGTDTLSGNVGKGYHSMLCNTPEDHRSHQHRGRSLKSSA
jgi:hypothetical protein